MDCMHTHIDPPHHTHLCRVACVRSLVSSGRGSFPMQITNKWCYLHHPDENNINYIHIYRWNFIFAHFHSVHTPIVLILFILSFCLQCFHPSKMYCHPNDIAALNAAYSYMHFTFVIIYIAMELNCALATFNEIILNQLLKWAKSHVIVFERTKATFVYDVKDGRNICTVNNLRHSMCDIGRRCVGWNWICFINCHTFYQFFFSFRLFNRWILLSQIGWHAFLARVILQ